MTMMPKKILGVLVIVVISRCGSESTNGYSHSNVNAASQIGDLLKPPPRPPLSSLLPVPFHGGARKTQRQNFDIGYQYPPPSPPLPSPPLAPSTDFKFPAPFYKQYNFNFLPPPQPFSSTPSPSIFQKVSGWLFPSKEVSYEAGITDINNITPLKKDCNPCNLVPWIPVLRYKVGTENKQQSLSPTYGPPSPTAFTSSQNTGQYRPQYLNTNNYDQRQHSFSTGTPHEIYGPPKQSNPPSISFATLGSTYGPPSATLTVPILQDNPISSTLTLSSNSYNSPSISYGPPNVPIGPPSSSYGLPLSFNSISSSTVRTPTSTYGSPHYDNNRFLSSTYSSIAQSYYPEVLNKELPKQNDVEILNDIKPASELELPKVTSPTGFKNSYGELITNTYALDIPYSVSATAAESTKIKTEVVPYDTTKLVTPNTSVALANPAPFTLNRGRNIHTLQPVALPNLSVSPLPPIFNARPFRPTSNTFTSNGFQTVTFMQGPIDNVKVEKSVPISEFTHSIEYPTTVIQSPIIDIDASKSVNQTKGYRNIPNSFVLDEVRDISSQASEDHISAAKSQPEASFETTGADYGNELYEAGLNIKSALPPNHKKDFADLRGLKDEDIDKYRTESNLQNIDSPLLYLKPSAPHKDYENFVTISTPVNAPANEYEMYDDIPTTTLSPQQSTFTSAWDESRTYFSDLTPPTGKKDQVNRGKIIQIIVPYTTGQKNDIESWPENWKIKSEKDFLARKVQSNTESYGFTTSTTPENVNIDSATDNPQTAVAEYADGDHQNTHTILNDLYDVKEPPFDIIKLQHTIDDWTEQEYSNTKYVRTPQKTRSNEKYAKQIPDDYFTTTVNPLANYVTSTTNYNYDFYDHEGSSSNQHIVTDNKNGSLSKFKKEYNVIERTKQSNHNSGKNDELSEIQKLHIYTAASSFRTSTSTPAPWSEIQTSISPLTKEKVYVVTSKPWREKPKAPEYDYDLGTFESKKTESDSAASESDDLPFKSPRFSDRPAFGFKATGAQNHLNLEALLSSKEWHYSINDLRSRTQSEHLSLFDASEQKDNISVDEDTPILRTATK